VKPLSSLPQTKAERDPQRPWSMAGVITMSESTSGSDLFNILADEFARRYRHGEHRVGKLKQIYGDE
jgi:hypothetical protein